MAGRKLRYPGSRIIKDAVRRDMYVAIRGVWSTRPLGDAATLCGREPRDADGLASLGFIPEECWFVDRAEPAGLRAAKAMWPQTNIYAGEIGELLRHREFAFINLDLMELPGAGIEALLDRARVVRGGVLALTFVRGREHDALRARMSGRGQTFEEARWNLVGEMLGGREIYRRAYKDHSVAMGTIAVVR